MSVHIYLYNGVKEQNLKDNDDFPSSSKVTPGKAHPWQSTQAEVGLGKRWFPHTCFSKLNIMLWKC